MEERHKENRDTDIKLLKEYRHGNSEAGDILSKKYIPMLHFMLKKVPYSGDSDEYIAVGLVTLKNCINQYVIPEGEKLDTAATFASYLYRALLSAYWRVFNLSKKKHELHRSDELLAIIPAKKIYTSYYETKKNENKKLLKKLLATLSKEEREAIKKHFAAKVLLDNEEVEKLLKKLRESYSKYTEIQENCNVS